MKAKTTFKTALLAISLLLQFSLQAADAPPITLHVEEAGTLSSLIPSNKKFEITNLTLTGNLDSRDIRYIREMAYLSTLNLMGANIVSYRHTITNSSSSSSFDANTCYYSQNLYSSYYYYHTERNSISGYMFYNCTRLTSVTIPNNVTSIGYSAFEGCTALTNVSSM